MDTDKITDNRIQDCVDNIAADLDSLDYTSFESEMEGVEAIYTVMIRHLTECCLRGIVGNMLETDEFKDKLKPYLEEDDNERY